MPILIYMTSTKIKLAHAWSHMAVTITSNTKPYIESIMKQDGTKASFVGAGKDEHIIM